MNGKDRIKADAEMWEAPDGSPAHSEESLRNQIVSHELGHKMGLEHPQKQLASGADQSAGFSEANYWVDGGIHMWLVIEKLKNKATQTATQEFRSLFDPNLFPKLTSLDVNVGSDQVVIAGETHDAIHIKATFSVAFPDPVLLFTHEHDLMDFQHDHIKLQDRIDPNRRAKESLKN